MPVIKHDRNLTCKLKYLRVTNYTFFCQKSVAFLCRNRSAGVLCTALFIFLLYSLKYGNSLAPKLTLKILTVSKKPFAEHSLHLLSHIFLICIKEKQEPEKTCIFYRIIEKITGEIFLFSHPFLFSLKEFRIVTAGKHSLDSFIYIPEEIIYYLNLRPAACNLICSLYSCLIYHQPYPVYCSLIILITGIVNNSPFFKGCHLLRKFLFFVFVFQLVLYFYELVHPDSDLAAAAAFPVCLAVFILS